MIHVFEGVSEFIENTINKVKNKGYLETINKRKRYLPDINSNNLYVRGHVSSY